MSDYEELFLSDSELDNLYYTVQQRFDSEAALKLIRFFAEALKPDGHVQLSDRADEILHAWIGQAFRAIVGGDDAAKAFGLKRPRGAPARLTDQDMRDRDRILAAKMIYRMEQLRASAVTDAYHTAIGDVANEVFSPDTGDALVEKAYKRHRESLHELKSIAPAEFQALVDTDFDPGEFKGT
jgi:SAM-dependent methyltransferase